MATVDDGAIQDGIRMAANKLWSDAYSAVSWADVLANDSDARKSDSSPEIYNILGHSWNEIATAWLQLKRAIPSGQNPNLSEIEAAKTQLYKAISVTWDALRLRQQDRGNTDHGELTEAVAKDVQATAEQFFDIIPSPKPKVLKSEIADILRVIVTEKSIAQASPGLHADATTSEPLDDPNKGQAKR